MKRYRWKIGLLGLCIFGLMGCGMVQKQTQEEEWTIGVVTKSRNSEYWMSVRAGMEEAAEKLGVKVVILSPDTETDKTIQKKMIQDLIKTDVDAIAISPIDSYDNRDYAEKAEEQGILLYAYDTPIEDVDVPYVGIDNKKVGYDLAKALAENMGDKGSVAIIAGSMEQACHEQRVKGFEEYLAAQAGIQIELVKSGYSNLRVSEQEIEEILEEHPNLDGILTTSAVTALGLAEATSGTGIKIAGVDAQEDALHAVEDGRITALGAQYGYDIGYETVSYIIRDKEGKEQEKQEILEVQILTRENVKKYKNLKK